MWVCVCAHVKLIIQESVIGRKLVASLHFNPLKSWNILMIVSSNSSGSNEMFRLKWLLWSVVVSVCLQLTSAVASTVSQKKLPQWFPWTDWCMMGRHVPTRTLTASASEESVRSLFEFPTSPDRPYAVMFLLSVWFYIVGFCCSTSWCMHGIVV